MNVDDIQLALQIALADAEHWQKAARSDLCQRYKRERDRALQDLQYALDCYEVLHSELDAADQQIATLGDRLRESTAE